MFDGLVMYSDSIKNALKNVLNEFVVENINCCPRLQ